MMLAVNQDIQVFMDYLNRQIIIYMNSKSLCLLQSGQLLFEIQLRSQIYHSANELFVGMLPQNLQQCLQSSTLFFLLNNIQKGKFQLSKQQQKRLSDSCMINLQKNLQSNIFHFYLLKLSFSNIFKDSVNKQLLLILYLNHQNIQMRNRQQLSIIATFLLILLSANALHQSTKAQHYQINFSHHQTNETKKITKLQVQQIVDSLNSQISLVDSTVKQLQSQRDQTYISAQAKIQKCKNIPAQTISLLEHSKQNIQQDFTDLFFKADAYRQQSKDYSAFVADQSTIETKIKNLSKNSAFFACPTETNTTQNQNQTQNAENQEIADLSKHIFVSNIGLSKNWVWGNLTENQYKFTQYSQILQNNIVLCEQQTPFASQDGQFCTKCLEDTYFNLQIFKCQACSKGTQFNQETHLCQLISSNKCDSNKIYVQATKKCQCPANRPYFDGSNCISCYIPNFWNKLSSKCQQCPIGSYYSLSSGKCEKCSENKFSNSMSCQKQCTLENPYFDGEGCVACDKIYNVNTNKCEQCQSGTHFDEDKKICIKQKNDSQMILDCQEGYIFNKVNSQCVKKQPCVCPQNYIYNEKKSKCQCPKEAPYDNGKKCLECKAPKYWNQTKKQCLNCQTNEYYSLTEQKCIVCPKQSPVLDQNNKCIACNTGTFYNQNKKVCQSSEHYCPKTFVWSDLKMKCVCPQDKPIQTDQGCASKCTYPLIWSQKSNQCTSATLEDNTIIHICKFGQIYNQAKKICVCAPENPYRTSEGCINCFNPMVWSQKDQRCIYSQNSNNTNLCQSNYIFDSANKICSCPPQSPFNTGSQCISCYLPMYWSHSKKLCLYCPQNQFFNTLNRLCENCPAEKPLMQNYICISCPAGTIFSLVSRKCQKLICQGDSFYQFQKNECSCPTTQKPFYNGKFCVQCKSPNRWDINTKMCIINTNLQPQYISPMSISPIPISSSASFKSFITHSKKQN